MVVRKMGLLVGLLLILDGAAMGEEIRLIVRGDDLGMTQGSLVAFERAYRDGILTCASMLVPAPWFEGATGVLKANPGLCTGVHLALVGEWQGYRWRPVQPWDKVPSLVDENGFLFGYPAELLARKPKLDEIEAEWRAQITLARQRVRIDYLDAHYLGLRGYPGIEDLILRMAKELRLPVSGWMGEKRIPGVYRVPIAEKKRTAEVQLQGLSSGLWLWVNHPGIDSPEHNALIHTNAADIVTGGGVGKHRAEETNVLTSPEIKDIIKTKGIRLTGYRDFAVR